MVPSRPVPNPTMYIKGYIEGNPMRKAVGWGTDHKESERNNSAMKEYTY